MLKTTTKSKRTNKFATLFADAGDPLLRKAETEQARQVVPALTSLQTYAASHTRLAQWFTMPFPEKLFFPLFLSWSTFLQIGLTKEAAAKTCIPQFIPTAAEALLLSQYLIREQLQSRALPSCIAALKNQTSDWCGCSAHAGMGCSVQVHWLGKHPDCVLTLSRLRR